jgi:hypothetical protein
MTTESKELSAGRKRKKSGTIEYSSWHSMKRRCLNATDAAYKYYGGRGIRVCERWLDFENFVADMGPRPDIKHTLDRIDCNGNYEPSNCRWATAKTQQRNRTNNRLFKIGGETKTLADWCEIYGVKYYTTHDRIRKCGMGIVAALTTPDNTSRKISLRTGKPTVPRNGERNGFSKLTNEDVREIREQRAKGRRVVELAEEFQVHESTIRVIARGVSWGHLK